jgi:hypothetical protein
MSRTNLIILKLLIFHDGTESTDFGCVLHEEVTSVEKGERKGRNTMKPESRQNHKEEG